MKTMKIEKKLLFTDRIIGVDHLDVKAALVYQMESDGSMRALGPLFIKGNVQSELNVQPFQEVLDLDVLAPAHKLDGSGFSLNVEDCYGEIDEDGVNLKIHMGIKGLVEEGNEVIDAKDHEVPSIVSPVVNPTQENMEETPTQTLESETSMDEFEDLFEDADTTFTSYRMIVAKADDSYDSIANRYEVSEEDLKVANRNKEIVAKSLIVLPF